MKFWQASFAAKKHCVVRLHLGRHDYTVGTSWGACEDNAELQPHRGRAWANNCRGMLDATVGPFSVHPLQRVGEISTSAPATARPLYNRHAPG
jgi:hypothetical protein